MLDVAMAISHHLIEFLLFAILFVEFVSVRRGMDVSAVVRVATALTLVFVPALYAAWFKVNPGPSGVELQAH